MEKKKNIIIAVLLTLLFSCSNNSNNQSISPEPSKSLYADANSSQQLGNQPSSVLIDTNKLINGKCFLAEINQSAHNIRKVLQFSANGNMCEYHYLDVTPNILHGRELDGRKTSKWERKGDTITIIWDGYFESRWMTNGKVTNYSRKIKSKYLAHILNGTITLSADSEVVIDGEEDPDAPSLAKELPDNIALTYHEIPCENAGKN